MSETKLYKISPEYKKSTYQTEQWTNYLPNGNKVILEITTYFRYGDFEVELSEMEKNEILEKDEIVLNDYNASCNELWNGCDLYQEIPNEDKFTHEEKKEIHKLMYFNKECPEDYDENCDDMVNEDILEDNDWYMDDTTYGISCKCIIEEM